MGRPLGDPPAHGTRNRYQRGHDPCRCDLCTTASTEYHRQLRARHRADGWVYNKGRKQRPSTTPSGHRR